MSSHFCSIFLKSLTWRARCDNISPKRSFSSFVGLMSYNYGAISGRDSLGYACQRPGYSKDNEKPGAIKDVDIVGWCEFMKKNDVKHIVSLLGDDEAEWYATPIDELLEKNGFDLTKYTRTSVFADGARDKIVNGFKHADELGEKFVVHCSGGTGRASVGASLWLMHKYGLTAHEAADEITKSATIQSGVSRSPNPNKAEALMENGNLVKK
eukprot:CFRG0036T1